MKDLSDIKKVELEILDEFIRVCEENNLNWFADSGTLLGAIRKGKMIEWDDDIDVIMPREDFNKFIKIATQQLKKGFFFQSPETDTFFCQMVKIRKDDTTNLEVDSLCRNQYDVHFHNGIYIDIFVFDAVPNNDDEFTSLEYFLRYLLTFSEGIQYNFSSTNKGVEIFRTMNDVLTFNSDKYKNSEYVANLLCNKQHKYMHKVIHRSSYDGYFELDFEGLQHRLRIPIGYDDILKCWYGDDWHIEKQVLGDHKLGFYDVNKSYQFYKNLKYNDYLKLFE